MFRSLQKMLVGRFSGRTARRNTARRNTALRADGPVLAILLISLVAVLTHGVNIPRLGYYYDDWYMLWSAAARGVSSLMPLFSMDRPFMGVIYTLFYHLIGQNIAGWHLAALFFRILGGIAFYWILNLAWPKLKSLSVLASMLFVVFPGFLAEPNAATKINHLIGFSAALVSIALTLQAQRSTQLRSKMGWTALSVLFMALYLWIYEYMIGLEVMRFALLGWLLWQEQRVTHPRNLFTLAKKLLRAYLPYIFMIAVFLFWRVFLFDSSRNATDMRGLVKTYYADMGSMLLRLIFQLVKDFLSAGLFAWWVQPFHLLAAAEYPEILTALLTAAGVVVLALGYIYFARTVKDSGAEDVPPLLLMGLGGLIVFAAVFPVVLSNRFLNLMDAYKSYALHPSPGAILIVLGLLLWVRPAYRKTILIVLLGLSVMTQSLNGQNWATYWQTQRNFFWQLTWRIPDFHENTLVIGYLPSPYAFHEDYEIWGPLNLIYRPKAAHYPQVQAQILNTETIPNILAGPFISTGSRDIYTPAYYANSLIVSQPTRSTCVHVIDGALPIYSSIERPIVEWVGRVSNVDLIDISAPPPLPPPAIFGSEPAHGWCYYYQQAGLARQNGDWGRIGDLYQTAVAAGLKAADSSENFVFVEGLVNSGQVEKARSLVESAIQPDSALKFSLCKTLSAAPSYPASFGYHLDTLSALVCK